MQINSLAVFCGSKSGNNPLFEEQAKALGRLLSLKNITLIYGCLLYTSPSPRDS